MSTMALDAHALIVSARRLDRDVVTVLEACEAFYMNGTADDVSGDVESLPGHFYRVARWVVLTDSQGFRNLSEYDDEAQAVEAFLEMSLEFEAWQGDDA